VLWIKQDHIDFGTAEELLRMYRSNEAEFESALIEMKDLLGSNNLPPEDRPTLAAAIPAVQQLLPAERRIIFLLEVATDDDQQGLGNQLGLDVKQLREELQRLAHNLAHSARAVP
jgi:hypothetical protein